MKVLLDMDGVLVNTVGGICDFFDIKSPYVYGASADWDLSKTLGIQHKDLWPHLGYEFWRDLKPYPWMKDVVSLLEENFGKENICLLTSPCGTRGCGDGKTDWAKEHLPDYKILIGSAKEFCASPDRLLVDDNNENVAGFRKEGGYAFLFAGPWNAKHKIVDPYKDLEKGVGFLSEVLQLRRN